MGALRQSSERTQERERGEFTLIEPLKYHVARNGGTIVKLFLCHSVDRILHLLRHFRQVLTSRKPSEHRNLSVGVGGSKLIKEIYELKMEELHTPKWLNYPEFQSGPNQATNCG